MAAHCLALAFLVLSPQLFHLLTYTGLWQDLRLAGQSHVLGLLATSSTALPPPFLGELLLSVSNVSSLGGFPDTSTAQRLASASSCVHL